MTGLVDSDGWKLYDYLMDGPTASAESALKAIDSTLLALTERGSAWVSQFESVERPLVIRILNSLTLISHSEFERAIDYLKKEGALKHAGARKFDSISGMQAHICGLIDYANAIQPEFAEHMEKSLREIEWPFSSG